MSGRDLTGLLLDGRYRLLRKIGEGGMGAVYEGLQEDLRRRVAVKVLFQPVTDEALRRFQREARAVARLRNPHIVQLFDFRAGGSDPPFLVMELLDGTSLRDLIRTETLPQRRVALVAQQVLLGLSAAHDAGILHRDIKPGNVVVTEGPRDALHVTLVDFGAAKVLHGSQGAITHAGELIGTLSYMSPEQILGQELDGRTDLYSLAVCMYRACTGRNPFLSESPDRTTQAILRGRFEAMTRVVRRIDPAFSAIVARGMHVDRDQRYPSASAMAADLEAWLDGDVSSSSLSPLAHGLIPPAPPERATTRRRILIGGLLALGLVLGGAASLLRSGAPTRSSPAAQPAAVAPAPPVAPDASTESPAAPSEAESP